jgi:hypothetical protein
MILPRYLERSLTLFPNNLPLGPLAVSSYPHGLILRQLEIAKTSFRSPMDSWSEDRKLCPICRNSNNVLLTAHGMD